MTVLELETAVHWRVRTLEQCPGEVVVVAWMVPFHFQDYLTPAQARELAAHLVAVADEVVEVNAVPTSASNYRGVPSR